MASYPTELKFLLSKNVENEPKITHWKTHQHTAALLANLAAMCCGIAMAWTSPALPLIQRETNVTLPLYATEEQASWISSLLPIGALTGALPAGYMANIFGRRKVLLVTAVVYLIGWVVIVSADVFIVLVYLGRFILGLAVGVSLVLVPLYSEEIAEDSIRGAVGAYLDFMLCIGFLYMYVLGTFLSYISFTVTAGIIPLIFAVTFFWMPETPTFLVSKNLITEAENSLKWLRNSKEGYNIDTELQCLRARFEKTSDEEQPSQSKRTTMKAVAIIFGLMFFQQMCGINAVIFYTVQIFEDAGSSLPSDICTIIVGVVQVIAVFVASLAVDHLGRRPILLFSSTVMAICLASLSAYFYFRENAFDIESWRWLPLASLIVYVIVFSVGFGPLPWFMMVELVPNSAKGWVTAIAVSFNWAVALLVTKLFPYMLHHIGQDITYGVLCSMCILGTLFVALAVPETKGKSREEIQLILGN
ncbi:facilitated trehalose transporter Tret1 isoform X1 [Anabrus simplex]|uniref:facilitated trehalose transporter Tret1 isoform X1 n=1 Tax=Anabrus simplex TaxID=316456 RepID=UPI0035A34E31